jgi:hypothetical protein
MQLEIFYDPKFDFSNRERKYTIKASPISLNYHIRQLSLPAGSELLDLGGGDGSAVGLAHADRGVNTTVVDQYVTGNVSYWIIRGIHMLGHFNSSTMAGAASSTPLTRACSR